MLRIVDLKKAYYTDRGPVPALRGISFEVPEGDFFTLLGPSGSGKSTALRCVAGLEHAQDGEIYIGDTCVFSADKGINVPPDERPIGMVFQSYAIWPHMDVFHNVAFPLLYGSRRGRPPREEIRARVNDALAKVQMEGYEKRPATQLSGGQQQRVALARAVVREPKLLLLDEPLSNLDAKLREEMRIELKEITRKLGITSFFVTHDQLEALAMSDRIGVIMNGELVEMGGPHEVYTHSRNRMVAGFLGVMNTLAGRVTACAPRLRLETEIGTVLLAADGAAESLIEDAEVSVLLRPEAIQCSRVAPGETENVFEGTVRRISFLGAFVDGEIEIASQTLKVNLNPFDAFRPGDRIYLRFPAERLQLIH